VPPRRSAPQNRTAFHSLCNDLKTTGCGLRSPVRTIEGVRGIAGCLPTAPTSHSSARVPQCGGGGSGRSFDVVQIATAVWRRCGGGGGDGDDEEARS
jgi:hypothetical protein